MDDGQGYRLDLSQAGAALNQPGYYYEHVNGTVHWKPFMVVDMGGGPAEYFDSPFVKRWWRVEESTNG